MSLIGNVSQLRIEDFPSQKEWIGKLLFPLNQFLTSVTESINGNVTFGDNIPTQTQILNFIYSSTADFPKVFRWNLPVKPVEMRLCSAQENNASVLIAFSWSYTSNQVSIDNILKLSATGISQLTMGAKYNIVIRGQY